RGDALLGPGHVDHRGGAGDDALAVRGEHALHYAGAQAVIVGVHDQPPRATRRAVWCLLHHVHHPTCHSSYYLPFAVLGRESLVYTGPEVSYWCPAPPRGVCWLVQPVR